MEPERAVIPIRREVGRKGTFVLELVDGAHEIRRLGTSAVVVRFPGSAEGTEVAFEDLAMRARRERSRLLLPRLLGVVATIAGLAWVTATIFTVAQSRSTRFYSVRTGAQTILITTTLLLVGSFVRRRMARENTE